MQLDLSKIDWDAFGVAYDDHNVMSLMPSGRIMLERFVAIYLAGLKAQEPEALEDAHKYHKGLLAMAEKIRGALTLQHAREYAYELKVELGAWTPPPPAPDEVVEATEPHLEEAMQALRDFMRDMSSDLPHDACAELLARRLKCIIRDIRARSARP